MRWVAASEFYHEPPDEHVIRNLDTAEFLWWTAGQGIRRAWPEALHRHLKLSDENQHVIEVQRARILSLLATTFGEPLLIDTYASTLEPWLFEPPWKTKPGSKKSGLQFEKLRVRLPCLTGGRETVLVRVIGRFEKARVRQIVFHCGLKIWF